VAGRQPFDGPSAEAATCWVFVTLSRPRKRLRTAGLPAGPCHWRAAKISP